MMDKAVKTIEKYNMLQGCGHVLIGLSGGADSVALLFLFLSLKERYGFSVSAAHVNHCIRGKEADRDEEFCRELCMRKEVPFYSTRVDVVKLASSAKKGVEECARQVRYDYFAKLCKAYKIDKTATAHNADDNAETVIFNMTRGSGIAGLCGISPVRDNIIRPLIEVSRQEIEEYLKGLKQEYVIDSTNLKDDYSRNKIRHFVMPVLRELNPKVADSVARMTCRLREDRDFLDGTALPLLDGCINGERFSIEKEKLTFMPPSIMRRVISNAYTKITGRSLEEKHIKTACELVIEGKTGNNIELPDNMLFRTAFDKFIMERNEAESLPFLSELNIENGKFFIKNCPFYVEFEITDRNNVKIHKNFMFGLFSFDKIHGRILIRSKKPGDKYPPLGFEGSRTVKKMQNEAHIDVRLRDKLPVFEYDGEVIWCAGLRISHKFRVTKETKRVLIIRVGERKE